MNSFDFGVYDPTDFTPVEDENASEDLSQYQVGDTSADAFDFGTYDYTSSGENQLTDAEQSALKDETYQKYYKMPEYTAEEIGKMSVKEKMQVNEDVEKSRKYLESKGFSKGTLSGLTFGQSERIEALKVQPHESHGATGKLVGSTLPIVQAGKVVGAGVKAVQGARAATKAPTLLRAAAESVGKAAGTGAVYETEKQTLNKAFGDKFKAMEIPKTAAEFSVFAGAMGIGKALSNKLFSLAPKQLAELLEKRVIPVDLTKSQYESAEEALSILNEKRPDGKLNIPIGDTKGNLTKKLDRSRITKDAESIGLTPSNPAKPTIKDKVGRVFSDKKVRNSHQTGQGVSKEVRDIDNAAYKIVGDLYDTSRSANKNIQASHQALVENLERRMARYEDIPDPSTIQKRIMGSMRRITRRLKTPSDVEPDAYDYPEISNQTLIDQIQSLRQIIDYDFAQGNAKNIFRPLITDLENAVLSTAEEVGAEEAVESWNKARTAYREWVTTFDNDIVRPYRNMNNREYSKLFKNYQDTDTAVVLNEILNETPQGQEIVNASTRDTIETKLGKFFKNPKENNVEDLDRAIRELEPIMSGDQAQQVRDLFTSQKKPLNIKAKPMPKPKPSNNELIASRYLKKAPEDIQKMMNTRTGIKTLRKDLSDTKAHQQVFDRMSKQKMRSILRGGNIEKDFTGNDMYKLLNKESNYELMSEFLGEKETELLRSEAKEIGKAQMNKELLKKRYKHITSKVITYKTVGILLPLI